MVDTNDTRRMMDDGQYYQCEKAWGMAEAPHS